MKIHTDIITRAQLYAALPKDQLHLECIAKGSRSHARAFDVGLEWLGPKTVGDGRYRRNHNTRNTPGFCNPYTATYDEWGEWLAKLFDIDPNMKATYYTDRDDFYRQTQEVKDAGYRDSKFPWLSKGPTVINSGGINSAD